MRKHDVRKWLHAILDLLPLIIIPVFMIYSHRHTIDSYEIETPRYDEVVMQQKVINGKPTSNLNNIISLNDNELVYDYYDVGTPYYCIFNSSANVDFTFLVDEFSSGLNNQYLIDFYYASEPNQNIDVYLIDVDDGGDLTFNFITSDVVDTHFSYIIDTDNFNLDIYGLEFYSDESFIFGVRNVQCFNLTAMFGSGNEPTIDEFNSLFSQQYYDFNSHASVVIQNGTNTYNDTDIGSQMFYCLYNSVDKYFNMGNVFNLTGVYDWFNANIFHGNIPPSMYVVWNIVLYEFVMDLLFLLYGLFMWFIDMVEKLMEKPFKSVK